MQQAASLNEIEQEPGKLSRHPAVFAHLHGRFAAPAAPLPGLPGVERAAAEDPRIRGESMEVVVPPEGGVACSGLSSGS